MAYTRKTDRRAFQPTIDGRLETRLLLTKAAYAQGAYPYIQVQSGAAGLFSRVILKNGEAFEIITTRGTVKAIANNKTNMVDLVLSGTTEDTDVSINPITPHIRKGQAHAFAGAAGTRTGVIQIGNITVKSGTVGTILGYNTAVLNGAINIPSLNRVDRIAFQSLAPGASISTGGDLMDLDIRQGANLSGSNSFIHVGRDLNAFNVANNLVLTNGANITIGRYLGLTAQPPRGTGPSGQAMTVQGNLSLDATSKFKIQALAATSVVYGTGTGVGNISVAAPSGFTIIFASGYTV